MLIQQGSNEWLELRKTKIGASDSAAILGISPWKTALQLYREKIGLAVEPESNERMKRGIELEPIAREWFEVSWGKEAKPDVRFHSEYEWIMASLDGLNDKDEFVLEIKCPGKETHELSKRGIIAEHYMCQIQHQLFVTGYKKAYYLSYYKSEGIVISVERNDLFIDNTLLPALKSFWDCLVNRREPEWQDADVQQQESHEWLIAASEWENLGAQIQALTMRQEAVKGKLVKMAAGRNSVGGGVKLIKAKRKGTVDYAVIPELKIVDLDQYRKPDIEYWMIKAG